MVIQDSPIKRGSILIETRPSNLSEKDKSKATKKVGFIEPTEIEQDDFFFE
jgi:hypothetical protein